MKKRMLLIFLTVALVTLTAACATPAPAPEELPPVKIGILRGFTGGVAWAGPDLVKGVEWALNEAGGTVAGREIALLQEDEVDTPEVAVAKAKKLVEQDGVDVVLGPLFADSVVAVSAYLKQKGVPHLGFGPSNEAVSDHTFWTYATGRGGAYPGGQWAYDDFGARKVMHLYTDFLFSWQLRDGFNEGFLEKGGETLGDIPAPFGETNMAPYLTKVRESGADLLAVFLVTPTDVAFVKQYDESKLDIPVFYTSALVEEEWAINQAGEEMLGMHGTTFYTPEIDTPTNKAFVQEFKAMHGYYPMFLTIQGYWPMKMYIEALKATGGDADPDKITQAMLAIKEIDSPAGTLKFTPGRTSIQDIYIMKIVKKDRYTWDVVKKFSGVMPR